MALTTFDKTQVPGAQPFQAPVQATDTSSTSTTSATFTNTNLAASITPTLSAHRVKIIVSGEVSNVNGAQTAGVTVKRGSTVLSAANGFQVFQNNASSSGGTRSPVGFSYIDSPATTSSTTYTVAINANNSQTVQWNESAITAVIILEEIL